MFYIMTVAIAKHYGFDGWLFNIECEFFPFPTSPKFKAEELAKYIHIITKYLPFYSFDS